MKTEDLATLKLWIQRNIHTVRTLEEIAGAFDVQPNTLRKNFRKQEGKPLSAFLKEARVDAMKEMLKTSERCCFEIADHFQYAQDASAERMFKRATGMTMSEYRERHGNPCSKAACMDKRKEVQP
jgi:AraC-like DNA-binding protein